MPIEPPQPKKNLAEVNDNIARWNAKKAQFQEPDPPPSPTPIPPPTPPPTPPIAPNPIATGAALPQTGVLASGTNPIDTDFATPHASPPVAPAVNPTAPEPISALCLPAPAAGAGDAVPPEAAMPIAGREQGVTPDALNASSVNLAFRSLCSQKGGNGDVKPSPDTSEPDGGDAADIRVLGVTARLTDAEYCQLKADAKRRRKRMGALLRLAYFDGGTAVIVPELNQKKWAELAHSLTNINQITRHLNSGTAPAIDELRPLLADVLKEIHGLRADLVAPDKGRKGGAK